MKTFIVGSDNLNKLEIAKELTSLNDDLNICKSFIAKNIDDEKLQEYIFTLDEEDIVLAFKNNALLYIDYSQHNISGITLDDFSVSDIIPISFKHFNSIVDEPLIENEVLIIWIDIKEKRESHNVDVIESRFVQERIDSLNLPCLYFCGESSKEIAEIVFNYLTGNDEVRKEIIEENT
jgi:hypothetical protein